MWPWEHVAVAYVCYSLYRRGYRGEPPGDRGALLVVFGAVLPDLVDKPLSWGLGWFPQGYSVAHSVFVWLAVSAVVIALLRRRGSIRPGVALAFGWGSHLVGDVVYPAMLGEGLGFRKVLWPVVTLPPYGHQLGLLARALLYARRHAIRTLASGLGLAVGLEFGFMLLAILLWVLDDTPGLRLGRSAE